MAYWLLTGALVFEGDDVMQLLMQHAQATPTPPSARPERVHDIPEALDRLMLECLAKDPDARPQDMDELARRLRACATDARFGPDDARQRWDAHRPAG